MKPLIPILIVATTSLAVASVRFAQRASAEHERATAEATLRMKQTARIAELERALAQQERVQSLAQRSPSELPRAVINTPAAGATTHSSPTMSGGFASAGGGAGALVPRLQGPPMFQSEAARKFLRSRMKAGMRRQYDDVGSALGLSSEQAAKLVELIADQQLRMFDGRSEMPADPAAMQQRMRETQQKNNAEIVDLIGQDKLAQWQDYQNSLPERSQLAQLREQLDDSGTPLSEEQRSQMLAAMLDEKQRQPRPAPVDGASREDTLAQQNQWQEEYERNVAERAKQVLTADQYKTYSEYLEWNADMRRNIERNVRASGNSMVVGPAFVSGAGAVTFGAVPVPVVQPAPPARR